jgi:hypothetical protein
MDKEEAMAGDSNQEIIDVLKNIEKHLMDIKYEMEDIKHQMPKCRITVIYLQDIAKLLRR